MSKVVFLIRALNTGGAQRQLISLLRGMEKTGLSENHDWLVLTFYEGGQFEEEIRKFSWVRLDSLRKKGRWDLIGFLLRLVRVVRSERPDVMCGYLSLPSIFLALLKPFFPKIRTIWNFRISFIKTAGHRRLESLLYGLEALLSRTADRIIVNSQAGHSHCLLAGFPSEKMAVVRNGIDSDVFFPDPEAGRRIRGEWGILADEKLVGIVGRLVPQKDHTTFFEGAQRLLKDFSRVKFACIGEGPEWYRQTLVRYSERLGIEGHVIWVGLREDMRAVYNALDLLCSTSRFEGFPNVIAEAMACGVPSIASDAGDSADIIGDSGVIVPSRDADALAQGMKELLMGSKDALGNKARRRIIEKFGIKKLAEETAKVIWQKA